MPTEAQINANRRNVQNPPAPLRPKAKPSLLSTPSTSSNDERISLESLTSGVRLLKEIVLAVQ